jgi:hypothetical protein
MGGGDGRRRGKEGEGGVERRRGRIGGGGSITRSYLWTDIPTPLLSPPSLPPSISPPPPLPPPPSPLPPSPLPLSQCGICLAGLATGAVWACPHNPHAGLHLACIADWHHTNPVPTCPLCRLVVPRIPPRPPVDADPTAAAAAAGRGGDPRGTLGPLAWGEVDALLGGVAGLVAARDRAYMGWL